MARVKSTDRVQQLEQQQRELLRKLKQARTEAVKREREDAGRRAALLGRAALSHLPADKLATLIKAVIPGTIKAPADLALFNHWLNPAQAIELPAPQNHLTDVAT